MSAIGLPRHSRNYVMSASGYNHSQLVFERQQSLSLRGLEWEGRIKPLTSWSVILMRAAGAFVLLTTMAMIAV